MLAGLRRTRLNASLLAGSAIQAQGILFMVYVYVLYSDLEDKFYIGFTENLRRRITEHLRGKTHTVRRLRDPKLVYYEACTCKEDATKRERQLKTGFGRGYLRRRLKNRITGQ